MKCPHCSKELEMAGRVPHNVMTYNSSLIGKAECCGKAVKVAPVRSYTVHAVEGVSEDDWGEKIVE